MAGVLAGFATGAATSALALSAVSLLTSGHLPGPTPPVRPVEEIRTSVRPSAPDAAADAPAARDADPYVRPGAATGGTLAPDISAPSGAEPAAMPRPALQVAPPARPRTVVAPAEARMARPDPAVPVRTVPTLPEPGRGQLAEPGIAPAAPDPEPVPVPELPAEAAAPDAGSPAGSSARSPVEALAPLEASPPSGAEPEPDRAVAGIANDVPTGPGTPAGPQAAATPPADIIVLGDPGPRDGIAGAEALGDEAPSTEVAAPGGAMEEPVEEDVASAATPRPGPALGEGTSVQFKSVPATGGTERDGDVVVDRLPQIGTPDPAPETADVPGEPAPPVDAAEVAADGGPALVVNAAEFEASGDRPVLGILLRDASPRLTPEALAALDVPVTFVVDVAASDAAGAIALYRDAGFEVALSGDLPTGARTTDAEVAVEDWLRRYPGAVAFVEGSAGGLQPSREAAQGVMARLAESGHGLVTFPRGLNAAQQVAESVGVPSALVFRDIAGMPGQERLLDQAAFRASREDDVLVIGDADARTVAALSGWAASGGSERVQPSPVSYILKGVGGS